VALVAVKDFVKRLTICETVALLVLSVLLTARLIVGTDALDAASGLPTSRLIVAVVAEIAAIVTSLTLSAASVATLALVAVIVLLTRLTIVGVLGTVTVNGLTTCLTIELDTALAALSRRKRTRLSVDWLALDVLSVFVACLMIDDTLALDNVRDFVRFLINDATVTELAESGLPTCFAIVASDTETAVSAR
jgi:hypothetical protein